MVSVPQGAGSLRGMAGRACGVQGRGVFSLRHLEAVVFGASHRCPEPRDLQIRNEPNGLAAWRGPSGRGRVGGAHQTLAPRASGKRCGTRGLSLCPSEGATEEEKLLSRKMMKYWANFARTG